ncbi:metal-dependent hydrolase [Vibrio owensii]|uniref:metal-dependent hydrolase n=1 Tax=Vibrio owensii TaxID=696485 RepID=UPI0018F21CCA
MTGKGHVAVGFASAVYPSYLYQDLGMIWFPVICLATVLGSIGPDWLELPYPSKDSSGKRVYKRVIPHRTITHILSWWLIAAWISYTYSVGDELFGHSFPETDDQLYFSIFTAFLFGGVIHLVCDVPNKRPISIFFPWDRFKLNLWKSASNEYVYGLFVSSVVFWMALSGLQPVSLSDVI